MAGAVAKQGKPAESADPRPLAPGRGKPPVSVIVTAGVLALVAIQVVVTYVLMRPPSAASDSRANPNDKSQAELDRGHSEFGAVDNDFSEVHLGDFSLSNTKAVRGIIMHVDFRLAAVASSDRASNVESQVVFHQERIREAVSRIVRNSSLEELNDPNLGTLKRLIREEINRLFGKTLLTDVVINDIRVLEQ